ncbi:hypothetical protein [Mucilaginibacter sp. OK098]|uniref:hypothetical protein n=1 Tax=Mucilaginibacter sp. OK098 TaxID=1855297 RepID=UPI001F221152|nr:hypothetical protein [Mucilaginibacter sp. OK098]
MSKQIALGLYHSLSGGVSASNNLKTNQAHGGLTTMDNDHGCGEVVTTPTNNTVVSGDTTRNYVGNSIFTYMCNGYLHNNYNIDAYTLSDTLKTTETGTGFANSYYLTLNYVVKTTDVQYIYVTVGGTTSNSSHISKLSGGATTEYHDLATSYQLHDIATKRTAGNPVFVLGRADFSTTKADKDATTSIDGNTSYYSGYILFLPDNTAKVYFKNNDGSYKGYLINFLTGAVTAL